MSETTISAGDGRLTLITTFTCAERRQGELVATLEAATAEVFLHLPGFVSGSVHASRDRTRVVNYAQWASTEDFDAAQADPDVQKHLAQLVALAESADPRLYDVTAVYRS
jgi:quinol monooxygenase YgiN